MLGVRLAELCAYQDVAYARCYLGFVRQVWEVDRGLSGGLQFTRAVVRGLYKLMRIGRIRGSRGWRRATAAKIGCAPCSMGR